MGRRPRSQERRGLPTLPSRPIPSGSLSPPEGSSRKWIFPGEGPAPPPPETVRKMRVGPAQYDVAKDGSLVYLAGASSATAEKSLVWVDRDGRFEPVTQSRRAFGSPPLSPGARRVALPAARGGAAR